MKKFLKGFFLTLLIIIIGLNVYIFASGRTYIYKALNNTYLKGRSGPSIDEYHIFSNRKIETGKPQPWPIASDVKSKTLPAESDKYFKQYQTAAFLVIRNDSIRFEKYWENYNEKSVTNSFSMAKTWVSVLTGIAISDGKIKSVDQPVSDFLPEFKTPERSKIKILHLLTMSSGINFDESYVSPFAYPAEAYYGEDLQQVTYKYEVASEPGKEFIYLSGNTALLGFVLEKATGKKISDYASEKLWKPMGAEQPAFWSLDKENGVEKAYCCFNSNARDFARFGQLYLDSGRWKGHQLVPEEYVLASIQPAVLKYRGKKNDIYGYKWWLTNFKGRKVFYARGILGQYVIVIPAEKMVIVRLGKKREKNLGADHPADIYRFMETAFELEKIQ